MKETLEMALEDIKKLDECLDPEDWAGDESMLTITGRIIAALKEAIKNEKTCAELLSEQGYEYSRQTNALIKRHAEQMEAIKNQGGMCAKGQAFKDYVHQRLDAMGVPHSIPESEHDKAGCRIGGRLDYVEAKLKSQGEPVAYFDPLVADDDKGLSWTSGTFHTGKLYTSAPEISQTSLPAGWQLVPIAPTDAMFAAGDQFMECTSSLGEAWEAMLAAAPKVDKEEDQS